MRKKWIFILSVVVIASIFALAFSPSSQGGSSFISTPKGVRALYLLLENEGFPVEQFFYPTAEIEKERAQEPIALLEIGVPDLNDNKLLKWIEEGNILIWAPSSPSLPLGLGGTSGKRASSMSALLASIKNAAGLTEIPLVPSCPSLHQKVCTNVEAISSLGAPFPEAKDFTPVAWNKEGSFILWTKKGKGEIWAFSDFSLFTNEKIDSYDNVRFLYQLLRPSSRILFDEFHHGYTKPLGEEKQGEWNSLLLLVGASVLILTLGVVSRGVRYGAPSPVTHEQRGSSVDFPTVLGLLYREQNAFDALEWYRRGWQKRIAAALRVPSTLSEIQLIRHGEEKHIFSPEDARALERALSVIDQQNEIQEVRNAFEIMESAFQKVHTEFKPGI